MSGALTSDGDLLASFVKDSGHTPRDFFIYSMSGTADFAYPGLTSQIDAMADVGDGTFVMADRESQGNLAYRVREGYRHDGVAADEYTYNGLRFFWAAEGEPAAPAATAAATAAGTAADVFGLSTRVHDVVADPVWPGYGRLLFPVGRPIATEVTLEEVGTLLPWFTHVSPKTTVAVLNDLHRRAAAGDKVFYDIYTAEEKQQDPSKNDTGLFLFRGRPGGKVAIVNAGGGFVYVGAIHDSFPQAWELSLRGYNAYALIYRPGGRTGAQDLARAIAFIHDHAQELGVDTTGYSLWGGSAGARLAAWLGTKGTKAFGEADYPRPAAVITQYTGMSEVTGYEPPTYACVGTSDQIANAMTMRRRIDSIRAKGTDAEIDVFPGLVHGFGLGEGTGAQGWLDHAVAFWERQVA